MNPVYLVVWQDNSLSYTYSLTPELIDLVIEQFCKLVRVIGDQVEESVA